MERYRHWHGWFVILGIAILLGGLSTGFSAELDAGVHVDGEVAKASDWSVSRIRAELGSEIKPVQYVSKGQQHTANCVGLLSVLKAAGVQTTLKMDPKADPKVKNAELRLVIFVEGADGYGAAFSMAEMLSDIGNRAVWLELDVDGQPLPARDGPMRLIVPEDAKPGRWIREVAFIHVTKLGDG
jgi:DMSO/TMAO reductase YedYZ molybdopterin-dependent catalytic subunit